MKNCSSNPLRQPAQKRSMSASLRRLAARHMAPVLTVGALMALGAGSASAQTTLYWDPGLTPATPSGGTGTWNTATVGPPATSATLNWSNLSSDVAWTDNNPPTTQIAVFANVGGAVTIANQLGAIGVNIQVANYIFSGGTLVLGAGGMNITPGVTGTTFNNTLNVNTASSAINSVWTNSDLATLTTVQYAGSRTITITNADGGTTLIPVLNLSNGTSSRGAGFNGTGNVTINSLGSTATITAGTISTFSNSGAGTVTINGNNATFGSGGGTFTVRATGNGTAGTGVIALGNDGALGTAALAFNGGTIQASGGGTRTIGNTLSLASNSVVNGTQAITFNGTLTETTGTGGIAANRSITNNNTAQTTFGGPIFISSTVNVANTFTLAGTGATVVSGVIANFNGASTGAGAVVYSGTGSLTLSNANTYTGTTTVNSGTFIVNGSTAAASAVTVGGSAATGTPTLTGTGTVNGTVLINTSNGTGAAGTVNAGGVGTVGTLTTGAETFNTGGTVVFDFGNNNVDELISNSTITGLSNATFTFNSVGDGTLTNASYTIMQANGGFSDTNLPATVNNLPSGYSLVENGNQLQLVQPAPEPSQFVAFGLGMLGLGGLALRARRRSGTSAVV